MNLLTKILGSYRKKKLLKFPLSRKRRAGARHLLKTDQRSFQETVPSCTLLDRTNSSDEEKREMIEQATATPTINKLLRGGSFLRIFEASPLINSSRVVVDEHN